MLLFFISVVVLYLIYNYFLISLFFPSCSAVAVIYCVVFVLKCITCIWYVRGVFVYVCIWFTHHVSNVTSPPPDLVRGTARPEKATCLMRFRPLLGPDVTRQGVGVSAGTRGVRCLRRQGRQPSQSQDREQEDDVCSRLGALGEHNFNKVLMTCSKWPVVLNTTETMVDPAEPRLGC